MCLWLLTITIVAMQNIEFGTDTPDPAENASNRSDTDPEYRIGALLINTTIVYQ